MKQMAKILSWFLGFLLIFLGLTVFWVWVFVLVWGLGFFWGGVLMGGAILVVVVELPVI